MGRTLQQVLVFCLAIVGVSRWYPWCGVQFMRNVSAQVYGQRIERDMFVMNSMPVLLGKSMAFHDMQPVGEIMARVTNDVIELNLMMNTGVNILLGINDVHDYAS